jgi:hypothetical protein
MRNCRDIQPDLSAYLDGELAPSRRAEIEAHVTSCPRCQRELAGLRTLAAGVAALPRLQPAPRFLAEVRRKIAQGHAPESIPWADYLFRPFWLKVPLEAAAVIVIAMFAVRFMKPMPAGNVTTFKMAKAEKPNDGRRDALLTRSLVLPEKEAKAEPANEIAGESRRRIPVVAGGLTITAAPASGVAGWAQSLGIDQSKLHDVVTVIPDPQSKAATGQVFFVELPREFAAVFTSELLRNPGTNVMADKVEGRDESVVAQSGPVGSGGGELTGSVETNADARFLNRLLLNVEVKPPSTITTVLEIRVVPPAN